MIIIGCGGHARSVADIALDNDPETELVFYDENAQIGETMFPNNGAYRVLPLSDLKTHNLSNYFIAIGDNKNRKTYAESYPESGVCSIISKRAYLSKYSRIGKGCFVGNQAHLGPEARIGNYCIINNGAIIEHEVVVGDYSHVSVNSTVCGRCKIGNECFIGAGAVIKDGIKICDNVTVGANAVVVKDILKPGVYFGNPAHVK